MTYHAHTVPGRHEAHWQRLADHLRAVAAGAKARAVAAGQTADWVAVAEAAGWLHDLGKYRPGFKLHLSRPKGTPGGPDSWHKQTGAAHAWDAKHFPLAFAIAGHYGGMPPVGGLKTTHCRRKQCWALRLPRGHARGRIETV